MHGRIPNRDKYPFIIATHSPILMAYPEARIYALDSEGIHQTEYAETNHYRVTLGFLNNPKGMLFILMDDPAYKGNPDGNGGEK
jgi:predicted ATPase